ncbi:MAG: hypothetical protein J3Q66DRAFT_350787 [Benniella sp.]|nr:MAG: hypothetical protein J3Q66DRAFT_350787 [Benniella sp.]
MLDLTELDDVIYRQLRRHDMAQCAQVCKKWHSIVIPYLWRDVSWITRIANRNNRINFCRMVLEDCLAEQRHQEVQKKEEGMEGSSQAQPSHHPSALSKYGHWIRSIPCPDHLQPVFQKLISDEQDESPTPDDLIHHLLKRCPHVRVNTLSVDIDELDLESDNPKKAILHLSLPHLYALNIQGEFKSPSSGAQRMVDVLDLLDQHATELHVLRLDVDLSKAEMIHIKDDQTGDGPKHWTSLKELVLRKYVDSKDTDVFLSWLLRKCAGIKEFQVRRCSGIARNLVEGMLTHLPDLDVITLGDYIRGDNMRDDTMAHLISGSSKGWRMVKFHSSSRFGEATMNALAKHFATLESVDMYGCETVTSDHLVRVLSSCTRLHTLLCSHWRYESNQSPINAKVFVDVDPDTGSLKPWKCEKSLKVLKTQITGIPRPDLKEGAIVAEVHPGQARELHSQVYDRLARLTNLERLQLGTTSIKPQSDCLEMSLESGLDKLSGLNKLKELNISSMHTRIGVKEAQWIAERWLRLRTITGLCENEQNEESKRWLRENHPEIALKEW